MSNTVKCPDCGASLAANAPGGLCPNCLMALNLKTETIFSDDTPAAQSPLPPEQIAPHFPQLEILEFLGRGGMGVVYKARQKTLNRFVALKLMAPERVGDPKFAERFAREAQALATLNHPNIVTIHDFGQAGGFYYLLMEFVDGANLRHLLRAQKFTPEEALAIVPPLCEALQYAHERGIVHRDIKPENLLLDKTGRVKIADFGIAKMLGTVDATGVGGTATTDDTTTQSALGTRGYSAPEQQNPPQRVDSRADIYSLGVVLYEMLTGELPGKTIEAPSKKVQIDVRLDAVVLRALEKTPELRWQTAAEMRTQVETIVQTTTSVGGDSVRPIPETLDARILEREIRTHMTPPELEAYEQRRRWYALTCVAPIVVFAALMMFNPPAGVVTFIRDLFYISLMPIPFLMWGQSRFLCSTEWAKAQNIKPHRFWQLTSTPPGVRLALAVAALAICLFFLGLVVPVKSTGPTLHDSIPFSPVIAVLPVAIVFICGMVLIWLRRNPEDPAPLAGVRAWLALMDKGDYGGNWEAAAKRFKRAIKKNEWVDRAQITCQPLGRVISRKVKTTWCFGPRFTVKFDTVFAGLKSAVETVTFKRELDGQWRAIGYLILPIYADESRVRKMAWESLFFSWVGALACVGFFVQHSSRGAQSEHLTIWGIPLAALLGIYYGARSKERCMGRISRGVGLATLLVWMAMLLFESYQPATASQVSHVSHGSLADSPELIRALPTAQVIQVGLSKPISPWAWQELERRPLTTNEVGQIMAGVTSWVQQEYPKGDSEPISWLDNFLNNLADKGMVTDDQKIQLLQALNGDLCGNPVFRLREGDQDLKVQMQWRYTWGQDLFGLEMMNEVESATVDGQPLRLSKNVRYGTSWEMEDLLEDLSLPALPAGPHKFKLNVLSALVAKDDLTGLAKDAPSSDWPPAKKRWVRTAVRELTVYPRDAVIVSQTNDPALDPVRSGALAIKEVIIRSKGGQAKAAMSFDISNILSVDISFDVALRIGDQTIPCGQLWAVKNSDGLFATGTSELTADLATPGPEIQTADIVLTPDPKPVEAMGAVDRIWGGKIVLSGIALKRLDLNTSQP